MGDEVTRVLLLSANPRNTDQLRLNEEFREIREGLRLTDNRGLFDIKQGGAIRAKDLRRLIFSYNPHIVHFSGHSSTDGIFLENDSGRYNPVTGYALANLFSLFSETVRCVILNACYSREQAIEIVQQIPYVVGMSTRIRDDSAIQFAIGFYDALGAGRDIEDAYKFGCNAIQLEGGNDLAGSNRSLILPINSSEDIDKYSDIDEADKPVLLTRVREVSAVTPPSPPSSSSVEELPKAGVTAQIQGIDTAASPVIPMQEQPLTQPRKGLLWVFAGLLPLVVLIFVLWDYSQKYALQMAEPTNSGETSIPIQPKQELLKTTEEKSVKPMLNLTKEPVKKEKLDIEVSTDLGLDTKEDALLEQSKSLLQENHTKEIIQHEKEKAQRISQAQAEEKQQRIREENEAINKVKREQAFERKKRAEKKAERARLKIQEKALAVKRENMRRRQAEIDALAQRLRAKENRRLEALQKAKAARRAWQAKQDEIKRQRQQEEQKQWQQKQQESATAARQQQPSHTSPPNPQKKESAADRMAREVEELWFED